MRHKLIEMIEAKNVPAEARKSVAGFVSGDTVRVLTLIREGEKDREQAYEGVCIRIKNNGTSSTFTVRKISSGIGVERTFPLFSPRIRAVEKVTSNVTRRSRLFFLRDLAGKAARLTRVEAPRPTKGTKTK